MRKVPLALTIPIIVAACSSAGGGRPVYNLKADFVRCDPEFTERCEPLGEYRVGYRAYELPLGEDPVSVVEKALSSEGAKTEALGTSLFDYAPSLPKPEGKLCGIGTVLQVNWMPDGDGGLYPLTTDKKVVQCWVSEAELP
jgi:hypothetical protein